MATTDESTGTWFGADGQVSQLRGLLFKAGCLGATLLALFLVFVFLVYVAIDAIEPGTADPAWWATVATTVAGPAIVLSIYYYRFAPRAGEVAYTALGLPVAATLLAGGVSIVFRHIMSHTSGSRSSSLRSWRTAHSSSTVAFEKPGHSNESWSVRP